MSAVVALVHERGTVRTVTNRADALRADQVEGLVGRDLVRAIAVLVERLDADTSIAWTDRRQRALTDPLSWPTRLAHAHEIRHLGFASTPTAVLSALQAVAGEDPFVVPSGPSRVTWLLGEAAGIGAVSALRRIGFADVDDETTGGIALRLATVGLRAFDAGVLPRHDGELGSAGPSDRWSRADLAALIALRWGRTRRGPIRLAKLLPPKRATAVAIAPPRRHADPAGGSGAAGEEGGVDVVIPTLERTGAMADVLADLAAQDAPPLRVLVVEQRPDGTPSGLAALQRRPWPFDLNVETVRWLGASRARNRALRRAKAGWVALLDDDVRLASDLLSAMVGEAERWRADALSVAEVSAGASARPVSATPSPNRPSAVGLPPPKPVPGLGSGRCLVRRRAVIAAGGFDEQIEGWGEDMEIGLRLHHAGYAVLASQRLALVHLKAPRGGFRAPRPSAATARIAPLPSPLIVYRWLRFMPPAMLAGAVRSHLVRAARSRRIGIVAVPWLWLRYRAAVKMARAKLAQGPRLLDTRPETTDRETT